jgi:hypothetical protein
MIRVCKPGGTVSCVVSTMSSPGVWWQGDYSFEGADELHRLTTLESEIHTKFVWKAIKNSLSQNDEWHSLRYLKMFDVCELAQIKLHPYAYTINYNDVGLPLDYRRKLLYDETKSEIGYLAWRYGENKQIYNEHGFTDAEFDRYTTLLTTKLNYIESEFDNDRSYEWRGGFNFIVTGKKGNGE